MLICDLMSVDLLVQVTGKEKTDPTVEKSSIKICTNMQKLAGVPCHKKYSAVTESRRKWKRRKAVAVNTHKCSVVSSQVFGPMWKNVCLQNLDRQMLNGVHWMQSNFGHNLRVYNRVGSSFRLLKESDDLRKKSNTSISFQNWLKKKNLKSVTTCSSGLCTMK